MATKRTLSEAETLEMYRVALENAVTQPEIATVMAELGYDSAMIEEGKSTLTKTRKAYDSNKAEDDETSVAYSTFSSKKEQLEDIFSLHRKKAKVVFRNDALIMEKLAITGSLPKAYVKWLEAVKKFYSVSLSDETIQTKLVRLKITKKDLTATNKLISELETARAEYQKEKGESQNATKAKDVAFAEIDDWMSEFYAVAKIALEDSPQLLEALGKTVKS